MSKAKTVFPKRLLEKLRRYHARLDKLGSNYDDELDRWAEPQLPAINEMEGGDLARKFGALSRSNQTYYGELLSAFEDIDEAFSTAIGSIEETLGIEE